MMSVNNVNNILKLAFSSDRLYLNLMTAVYPFRDIIIYLPKIFSSYIRETPYSKWTVPFSIEQVQNRGQITLDVNQGSNPPDV